MTTRDRVIMVGVAVSLTLLGLVAILEPFFDRPTHIMQKGEDDAQNACRR